MMTIADIYETSRHRVNIAHFTAIVHLAAIDGEINQAEERVLIRFARKLDITPKEYKEILKNHDEFPCIAINSYEERLKHIFDLFQLIYADQAIDEPERALVVKYVIALGVPVDRAEEIVKKSINIFEGNISFTQYQYLLDM
ncbi:MAG: TerB family tellurite resistance protein [Flavobacteriaceae bacterium]|nr:TerB family tellurite resistance protein [Flavobacteriaceae bacterium]